MDKKPRPLSFHGLGNPRDVLEDLAAWTPPDWQHDRYGGGALLSDFEAEIAQLFGKEAAVFMPSGTMCQQIALRIWCDRQGNNHVAFHPTAHLEMHEQKAYQHVHGLRATLVGDPARLMTLDDLKKVELPLAALLIELPQREIGGLLPSWDELQTFVAWAREHDVKLHLDGARLWECEPFYGLDYAEMAAPFDTVYVSMYKTLGGLAGAILMGPEDVIKEAKVWRRRHGGELVTMSPLIISARKAFAQRLDKIPAYVAKAQEIAAALSHIPQMQLQPAIPPTNMCHVYLNGDKEALQKAAEAVREERGISLFGGIWEGAVSGRLMFEMVIGDAGLELDASEVASAFELLFEKVASMPQA